MPLGTALELKSKPIALALLEAGADPNVVARVVPGEEKRAKLLLHAALLQLPDVDIIDAFVARGVALDALGPQGSSALHVAVLELKNSDCAARLLHHGANINVANKRGLTPLMAAVHAGSATALKAMRWLIAQGADLNAVDDSGRNVLDVALGSVESKPPYRELFEAGAKLTRHALPPRSPTTTALPSNSSSTTASTSTSSTPRAARAPCTPPSSATAPRT